MSAEEKLNEPFGDYAAILGDWAREHPDATALSDDSGSISWAEMDGQINRIAAALQRDGLQPGQAVAILGTTGIAYALVYLPADDERDPGAAGGDGGG